MWLTQVVSVCFLLGRFVSLGSGGEGRIFVLLLLRFSALDFQGTVWPPWVPSVTARVTIHIVCFTYMKSNREPKIIGLVSCR